MNFKEWLLNEVEATSGKFGLYPPGYGGIGLYPDLYFIPIAADAITYLDMLHNSKNKHPKPHKSLK